jgi:hypothetical protein
MTSKSSFYIWDAVILLHLDGRITDVLEPLLLVIWNPAIPNHFASRPYPTLLNYELAYYTKEHIQETEHSLYVGVNIVYM